MGREHGDRDQIHALGRLSGRLQRFEPTERMNGSHPHTQVPGGLDRADNRMRNVMPLEVEKNRQPPGREPPEEAAPFPGHEPGPDLHPASLGQPVQEAEGLRPAIDIQGDNQLNHCLPPSGDARRAREASDRLTPPFLSQPMSPQPRDTARHLRPSTPHQPR